MYAEDDKHSQQMALSFELKGVDRWVILSIEAYDYDFELIGGRIVYNNYFAQTPFFILFLFFSIALGLLGILVIVLF